MFDNVMQDDRYSKYINRMAIVPLTYGRHVPIISDKVKYLGLLFYIIIVFDVVILSLV